MKMMLDVSTHRVDQVSTGNDVGFTRQPKDTAVSHHTSPHAAASAAWWLRATNCASNIDVIFCYSVSRGFIYLFSYLFIIFWFSSGFALL